jgi:DNA-binding MarR family transcriptional regulator
VNENENSEEARLRLRFTEIARELSDLAQAASSFLIADASQHIDISKLRSGNLKRSQKALLNAATLTYRLRRTRNEIFKDNSLFGEPAWDILLDLFIADLKGLSLSITDACIGSAVPVTTALRWITVLQHGDLVSRAGDPRDARRANLSLTDSGFNLMVMYFEQALDAWES